MPRKFYNFLDGDNIYVCRKCQTHLASLSQLISKAFRGQHGTAYLFNKTTNIEIGVPKQQQLTTGQHTIASIFCKKCQDKDKIAIGWKYIRAEQSDQKYKENKFILQEACIKLLDVN